MAIRGRLGSVVARPFARALVAVGFAIVVVATLGWRASPDASIDRQQGVVVAFEAGDVLTVDVDGDQRRVRLLGCAATTGAEASASAWVEAASRNVVLLGQDVPRRDDDAAWFAYVFTQDGRGETLNEHLIARGVAFADRRHPFAFETTFTTAESAARQAKLGVWSSLPADPPMPAWRRAWLEARRDARDDAPPADSWSDHAATP